MFESPSRKALIETALTAFQDGILPALEGNRKYLGLMIASALAIAVRELDEDYHGDGIRRVLSAYADLYGDDDGERAGHNAEAKLDALTRDLTRALREGVYDHALTGPVHTLLTVLAEEKLKLSNPKFLAAREYSQPTPS